MPPPSSSNPPKLLATTSDVYESSIRTSHDREDEILEGKLGNGLDYRSQVNAGRNPEESNSFRSAEWTPDGTSLITNSEDNCLRTFVVPPDLLEPKDTPIQLKPYCITPHPSTIYCHAIYPFFKLDEPATAYTLLSTKNHPLQLRSLLASNVAASYPLIHQETEWYMTPSSLVWSETAETFYAGTDSLVSVFDTSRYNSPPLRSFATKNRGIVSALDLYGGILALGTYTRWISLYEENEGVVDSFKLEGKDGKGITCVRWDRSRTYLYVSERRCNVVRIYDIRKPGKICGRFLSNSPSPTSNQKFSFDIGSVPTWSEHPIVVGGTTDGEVEIWTHEQEELDPYGREAQLRGSASDDDAVKPSGGWKIHSDPITSVAMHPTACVVATCSGERKLQQANADDASSDEGGVEDGRESGDVEDKKPSIWHNSLKIWSI